MKNFKDRVAVITGAASGIGRSLAERSAREGMKVVLADIEEAALTQTAETLRAAGADVLAVRTDVSKESEVKALAQKTLDRFGGIHLLCNNAGVGGGTTIWESTLADWQWIIGVNLWGVINGVRVFIPIMAAQDNECHIVNTASIAGLLSPAGMGIYNVTKHGVVTLSETLYQELAQRKTKVKISVLCPSWVKTHIVNSERNRPIELRADPSVRPLSPENEEAFWAGIEADGKYRVQSSTKVADSVFKAVRNEQLYILTHPESKDWIRARMEDILNERNPAIIGEASS